MYKIVVFCSVWAGIVNLISGDKDMGPGLWSVLNIQNCENPEQYPDFEYDIKRNRENRTHDRFNGEIKLDTEIDNAIAIRIEVCKFTDGGCKDFTVITDDSVCEFTKKHAETNFVNILTYMGVEPADCPLQPGEYKLEDYVFNYDELPDESCYGMFGCDVFLLRGAERIVCMHLTVEFKEDKD